MVGVPRESTAKLTKAEEGGIGGKSLRHSRAHTFRLAYKNEPLKRFVCGDFSVVK
jgi:hypothetical protein